MADKVIVHGFSQEVLLAYYEGDKKVPPTALCGHVADPNAKKADPRIKRVQCPECVVLMALEGI